MDSTTHSIIVYRNPLEQQFWESGMLFQLIVFMVLAVIFCMIAAKVLDRYAFPRRRPWGIMRPGWYSPVLYGVLGTCVAAAGYVAFGIL